MYQWYTVVKTGFLIWSYGCHGETSLDDIEALRLLLLIQIK